MSLEEDDARDWLDAYVANIAEVDLPTLGPRRNPGNIRRLLAALGRATGTVLNRRALASDVGGAAGPIAAETLGNYLDALDRLLDRLTGLCGRTSV